MLFRCRSGTYTAHGMNCWYLSAEEYLGHVIKSVEERYVLPTAYTQCPYPPAYHPEIDTTRELNDDEANYYQSLIGTLRWTIELGRLDIAVHVSKLSSHTLCPREGHLGHVLRIFAYLKKHIRSRLVVNPCVINWNDLDWPETDWTEFYPEASETIPDNMPEPLGNPVQINVFADAAHATDLINHHSTTGILAFLNSVPIVWY